MWEILLLGQMSGRPMGGAANYMRSTILLQGQTLNMGGAATVYKSQDFVIVQNS